MEYYVISVGGSGAKCAEALAHVCAAGLGPNGRLHMLYVDPDDANGCVERSVGTLELYRRCRAVTAGSGDPFRTDIRLIVSSDAAVWSPFHDMHGSAKTLGQFLNYAGLTHADPPAASAFDVLFSEVEKNASLEIGFLGHPSIGASVLAETVIQKPGNHWEALLQNIGRQVGSGADTRILLVGSVFGGTGAAGVATIARLLSSELEKIIHHTRQESQIKEGVYRIAAVLLLPYFAFDDTKHKDVSISSAGFGLRSKTVLKYYHQVDYLNTYDSMYLLGCPIQNTVDRAAPGGPNQDNSPHFVELYAALAAIDFFTARRQPGKKLVARKEEVFDWSSLPYLGDHQQLRQSIDALARFAFSYSASYYPTIAHFAKHRRRWAIEAPWLLDFFNRRNVSLLDLVDGELRAILDYCSTYLQWLADIEDSVEQTTADPKNDVNLIYSEPFTRPDASRRRKVLNPLVECDRDERDDYDRTGFSRLTSTQSSSRPHELSLMWARMCAAGAKAPRHMNHGHFVTSLFAECTRLARGQ